MKKNFTIVSFLKMHDKNSFAKSVLTSFGIFMFCFGSAYSVQAQTTVTLDADGPGNTYELINSVLAPGYNAVENPECIHGSFGRHIAEVWDAALGKYVFEFYIHVNPDNDRCINFDRQRVEIKTYESSPANLKGTLGETVTYKWQFRLPDGFQPSSSFTHIHQVKAVGGDEADPVFTLTARKGSVNKMELIHNNTNKVAIVDLSLFTGVWVEATEIIRIGAHGTYSMNIKRVSDNATILSYSNNDIMTIRPNNDFIRPKWGIYRSLNNPLDLRDETLRLASVSISESQVVLPLQLLFFKTELFNNDVKISWATANEINSKSVIIERSADGINFKPVANLNTVGNNSNVTLNYQYIDIKAEPGNNFYRLRQTDLNGEFYFSAVSFIELKSKGKSLLIYPNPVEKIIDIKIPQSFTSLKAVITNTEGKNIFTILAPSENINKEINANLYRMKPGMYLISLYNESVHYKAKFLKM